MAALAQRCEAVPKEIANGVLPFDRAGRFIDELLIALALPYAEGDLQDMPDLFDGLPTFDLDLDVSRACDPGTGSVPSGGGLGSLGPPDEMERRRSGCSGVQARLGTWNRCPPGPFRRRWWVGMLR